LFALLRERAAVEHELWNTFFSLAGNIPYDVQREAVGLVRAIPDEEARIMAFAKLARHISSEPEKAEVMGEGLRLAAQMAEDEAKARSIMALRHQLPPEQLIEALELAEGIVDEPARARALRALTVDLPEALAERALDIVFEIRDEASQLVALSRLARYLPEDFRETVSKRDEALTEQEIQVQEMAVAFTETSREELVYGGVDPEWAESQAIADDVDAADEWRTWILANASEAFDGYRYGERSVLLKELGQAAPLLGMGGARFVGEVYAASRDVARWYP
jgi:hypothetical protein